MLKPSTRKIPEDFPRLRKMNATQVMRALNSSLNVGMANRLVAQLQECKTSADFDQEIKNINAAIKESLTGVVPDGVLKQCTTYGASCVISRFVVFVLFEDVSEFEAALEAEQESNPTISIKEVFRRFFEETCAKEPLKSFFEARPHYKEEAEKIIPANFNVSQDVHIPKAINSGESQGQRMAYYFATMMTNSSNELFRQLLGRSGIASSLGPMNNFHAPDYVISLAEGGTPTSTCPVAHLDQETRTKLLELMEKNA